MADFRGAPWIICYGLLIKKGCSMKNGSWCSQIGIGYTPRWEPVGVIGWLG